MEFKIEENQNVEIKLVEGENVLAEATCFYAGTPEVNGQRIGTIGELTINNNEAGTKLLEECERILKEKGVKQIVAPMNGNTWKQYRSLKWSNGDAPFVMEKVSPVEYNEVFEKAGFKEIDEYTSTKGKVKDYFDNEILDEIEKRLADENITIRKFEKSKAVEELKKIYNVSVQSFCRNPFYTPIDEENFIAQYTPFIEMVDDDLILMAEKDGKEIGFLFAIPDFNEMQTKGKISTLILKTIAVLPEYEDMAIGNVMNRIIAKKALEKGFEDWIYAFMYKDNTSQKLAERNGTQTMREYVLFGKDL